METVYAESETQTAILYPFQIDRMDPDVRGPAAGDISR